jgi:oligopeptidase B
MATGSCPRPTADRLLLRRPLLSMGGMPTIRDDQATPGSPPAARRDPRNFAHHGDQRIDEYHWLRDRGKPEVIAYLEAENAYTKSKLAHTEPMQETLYREMLARIQETDLSVPSRDGEYFHYVRTEQGKQYAIHCRRHGTLDAPEEVILDENALAEGKAYFDLGAAEPSPSQRLLAYSVDEEGDERFTLRFKDLGSGSLLPEAIPGTSGAIAFLDEDHVLYVELDVAHRPYRVLRHRLHTDPAEDVCVFVEPDERFFVSIGRTRSDAYVLIETGSKTTSEVWFVPTSDPTAAPVVVEPRRDRIEYAVEHHGDRFFVLTNEDAVNFKLMETQVATPGRSRWTLRIAHRDDVHIVGCDAFARHIVVSERRLGVPKLRIFDLESGAEHEVAFDEEAFAQRLGENPEFETSASSTPHW